MITKEQALVADQFHLGECLRHVGPRGGVKISSYVWRRNGQTKVWKTRPTHFRVPVKFGLYKHGYVTHDAYLEWHTEINCPLSAKDVKGK